MSAFLQECLIFASPYSTPHPPFSHAIIRPATRAALHHVYIRTLFRVLNRAHEFLHEPEPSLPIQPHPL
jgi:hypothetical protein